MASTGGASDTVHLWGASLRVSPGTLASLDAVLSGDERQRADRFRFARDRDRFVAGRGLLRTILGGCLGLRPADLRFAYGSFGKPELADAAGVSLRFNIAHAGDRALYAVAWGRQVGVDLEPVRADLEIAEVAELALTPDERDLIDSLPPERRPECFAALWTRKEALAKATGLGLGLPFDRLDAGGVGDPATRTVCDDLLPDGRRWSLRSLDVGPGFAAALAVEGDGVGVSWRTWPVAADCRVRDGCDGV
jgi:4'-phosphopantetheinyl transferase